MNQKVSQNENMEKVNSIESRDGDDKKSLLGAIGLALVKAAKLLDNRVSDLVEAPSRGESGWYVHTGEGKAIAGGAEARGGAEEQISQMLRSRESRLAMLAVQQADVPPGNDYGAYLDAVTKKYEELLKRSSAAAEDSSTPPA